MWPKSYHHTSSKRCAVCGNEFIDAMRRNNTNRLYKTPYIWILIHKRALQWCDLHSVLLNQKLLDNRKGALKPYCLFFMRKQLIQRWFDYKWNWPKSEHLNPYQIPMLVVDQPIYDIANKCSGPSLKIRLSQVCGDARWTPYWNGFKEHHGRSAAWVWVAGCPEWSWASEDTSRNNSCFESIRSNENKICPSS